MSDTNTVIMTGNLTRTPELRYSPKGVAIADFGLASNRRYGKGDDQREEVCFVDVTVFGSTAEAVAKHLQKGRKVLVEGRLRFHAWETELGQKRSKVDLIAERVNFLPQGNKNGNGDGNAAADLEEAIQ
jgi:single-strand DNA-binding protein